MPLSGNSKTRKPPPAGDGQEVDTIARRLLLRQLYKVKRQRQRVNPLGFVRLNAPQLKMLDAWRDRSVRTLGAIGANQSGKSTAAAMLAIATAFDSDLDEWRQLPNDPRELRQWAEAKARARAARTDDKKNKTQKIWCLTTTFGKSVQGQQLEWHNWCPRCLIDRPKSEYTADRGFAGEALTLANGTVVLFKSIKESKVELETERVDLIWVDETIPKSVFMALRPRMIARGGRMIISTIPDAAWMHDIFVHKAAASTRWVSLDVDDNLDNLDEEATEEFKITLSALSDDEYRMRVKGEWVFVSGLVYGQEYGPRLMVEPADVVGRPWWNQCTEVAWIDPGYTNPCAVLFVKIAGDDNRTHYYHDCIYETRKTVPQIADLIKAKVGNRKIQVYGIDPASLQKHMGIDVTVYEQFHKAGIPVRTSREIVGNRDKLLIVPGILKVKSWMGPHDGAPSRIRILNDSVMEPFREELRQYRWKALDEETGQALGDRELTIGAYDHLMDNMRYDVAADIRYVTPPEPEIPRDSILGMHRELERAESKGKRRRRMVPR